MSNTKRRRLKKPIRIAITKFEEGAWFAIGLYITARLLLQFFKLI